MRKVREILDFEIFICHKKPTLGTIIMNVLYHEDAKPAVRFSIKLSLYFPMVIYGSRVLICFVFGFVFR